MAANIDPIWTRTPNCGMIGTNSVMLVTANTTKDLTSGTTYLLFTAGADGAYLKHIRIRPAGTNTNPTVVRIWINNGSTTATALNNTLYDEITVAATVNTEAAAIAGTEVPMNIVLPAGWKIYATTGTAVTAIFATAIGGDY